MSAQTILIIALVVGVALIFAIGWRAPDRSPGIEDKSDHDRIED
ncbi:MAG: hypothetical protein V4513_09445 [Pseudomonadota bacterium]